MKVENKVIPSEEQMKGFVEGDITVEGETIVTFRGVGKILKA